MGPIFLVAVFCYLTGIIHCCDPRTGPAGESICLRNSSSSAAVGGAWNACMADEYLRLVSRGADRCPDGAGYCWRPCTLEDQVDECVCTEPGATVPPDPSLPGWCYNPSGKSCNWYQECLNAKHPCGDSPYDYALSFGGHFCKAFDKTYSGFSTQGREWIDAVRRCLQVQLVPVLRPWESPSCEDIQARAFASHTGCYLSPAPGAPSICSLGTLDWWRVFWTVKDALVSQTSEMVKGFLDTAVKGCLRGRQAQRDSGTERQLTAVIRLEVPTTDLSEDDGSKSNARETADKIAAQLNWKNINLDWFAYVPESTTFQILETEQIIILIGDKAALGISETTPQSIGLENAVSRFASAVQTGTLSDITAIRSLTECTDLRCTASYLEVTGNGAGKSQSFKMMMVLVGTLAHLFSN